MHGRDGEIKKEKKRKRGGDKRKRKKTKDGRERKKEEGGRRENM